MIVYKEQVDVYRIGEKLFVVDEKGFLRGVDMEEMQTNEEWKAYLEYQMKRFEDVKKRQEESQRLQEEYEKRIQEEERRHEEEVAKIHFEIFGS